VCRERWQFTRLEVAPGLKERRRKFDRVERISPRGLVEPPKDRTTEADIEPFAEERGECVELERPDEDTPRVGLEERRVAPGSCRRNQSHRGSVETPERKFERRRGLWVEPMSIVDRHEDEAFEREQAEKGRQGDRDRPRLRGTPARVLEKQGDAKRPPLRGGKAADLIRDTGEQIAERGESELVLG